jgi:hypothetical protein
MRAACIAIDSAAMGLPAWLREELDGADPPPVRAGTASDAERTLARIISILADRSP